MSKVICDRRIAALVKGKVYKIVVRPAMMYDFEIRGRAGAVRVERLKFSMGVTSVDKIRNESIRGTAQV